MGTYDASAGDEDTPLIAAAQNRHSKVVGASLASGSKVNGARAEDGATLLHIPASEGFPREVATLLAAGIDKDARWTDDRTTARPRCSPRWCANAQQAATQSWARC